MTSDHQAAAPADHQRSDAAQPLPSPDPDQGFVRWLEQNRQDIIDEWALRLAVLSPAYRKRPSYELFGTAAEAFDANLEVLATGKLDRMERFINYITEIRLGAGFPLSDVQKAFELFRIIVVKKLKAPHLQGLLAQATEAINACLAHTIHRFSDHFQTMHERAIRKHAQNLERTVRQRTAELAESERRYKTLVDEINDGYFMIQDERIAYANRAFCRMHHAKLGEVLGRPYLDFVTEDCRSRVSEAYGKALKGRSAVKQLEFTRTGPPIERAATEIKSKVVDLGQGPVTIGICRDISQRVAMEAKIREHERLAYVGHIAASLSHEIRNPLSTCTLNMQILEEKLALDGFDRRRLVITVRELTRLENILRQLLDIARPVSLLPAPLDLKELAQDCLVLLEGKVAEKGIEIRQRHALDLPLIEADGAKLEQALLNLMLNAIEAVGQGGRITLWTRSRTHKTGSSVDLGVHDNGPGIDSQQMDQLFTPFATSKSQGTGLGLANVKRIAEAHHGKVIVKSRRGRGATFILRLPCAP